MSKLKKVYVAKLVFRCLVLAACTALYFLRPAAFAVLDGWQFFSRLSPLHILWGLWVVDMLMQILPVKNKLPVGSQKLFVNRFRPVRERVNRESLKKYAVTATTYAYRVFFLWVVLIAAFGVCYHYGLLDDRKLILISAHFYVFDLVCVVIWCPFRLLMKTRCCTTCRIFNWDHMMMLSPLIFVGGFFAVSLVVLATVTWLTWEVCVLLYPERFWEGSNAALKCAECTDGLCRGQCRKLRR